MHGGAFRVGCPEQVGPFAAALAEACAVDVICPAYRLAPEHPFPAGLFDGWKVLMAVADKSAQLAISGDSAGGGLAAGLAALSHQAGIHLAGLALLSPWLDLSVTDTSYSANAVSDHLFSAEAAREAAELYLQGLSPADGLASPLKGSVGGYPPTLISVGTGEVLAGDARVLRDRLLKEEVPVTFHSVDGMEHVAVTRDGGLPGSAETFASLIAFLDRVIAR